MLEHQTAGGRTRSGVETQQQRHAPAAARAQSGSGSCSCPPRGSRSGSASAPRSARPLPLAAASPWRAPADAAAAAAPAPPADRTPANCFLLGARSGGAWHWHSLAGSAHTPGSSSARTPQGLHPEPSLPPARSLPALGCPRTSGRPPAPPSLCSTRVRRLRPQQCRLQCPAQTRAAGGCPHRWRQRRRRCRRPSAPAAAGPAPGI